MNYRQFFPFVVEDDDDFAQLLGRAFLKAGVPDGNVRRYRDGEGALAHLASIDVIRPSALLLDIDLPGMTGLSVLERVRTCGRLAYLPAFFLSGRDDGHLIAAARSLGARGYWLKPQGNGMLLEIVKAMLGSLDGAEHASLSGNLLIGR
jgi:chemosensory pili system protein ChpA (sensor histidine kinase/response regulator)